MNTTKGKERLIYPEDLLRGMVNHFSDEQTINFKFKYRYTKNYGNHYYSEVTVNGIKYIRCFGKEEEMKVMLKELNKIAQNEKYREQFKSKKL